MGGLFSESCSLSVILFAAPTPIRVETT